jgi:hypothetical protein
MQSAIGGVFNNMKVTLAAISYPYPDGAMNIATSWFMKSPAIAMVVIDTDVVFTPNDLALLLSHVWMEGIVAGFVPLKQPGLTFPLNTLEGGAIPKDKVLLHVGSVSRGFMLIHRKVFVDMALLLNINKYKDPKDGECYYEYWKPMPGGHSEDFYFCNKWRECGGVVTVDTRIVLKHEGRIVYPIDGTYPIHQLD